MEFIEFLSHLNFNFFLSQLESFDFINKFVRAATIRKYIISGKILVIKKRHQLVKLSDFPLNLFAEYQNYPKDDWVNDI